MGKPTISMAIFNSFLYISRRECSTDPLGCPESLDRGSHPQWLCARARNCCRNLRGWPETHRWMRRIVWALPSISHGKTIGKPWENGDEMGFYSDFMGFTLWLRQNSCWKWSLTVGFPIKNGDFPELCEITRGYLRFLGKITGFHGLPLGNQRWQQYF